MASSGNSHDVGNGVDCANFMKVNGLNRNIVYLRLRMTKQAKGFQSGGLDGIGQSRISNDLLDLRERPAMHMRYAGGMRVLG